MSATECRNCVREVQDGADICSTCTDGLMRALQGVPDLLDNLLITFSKQDRLGAGGGHRGKLAEAPLPVRFDITRVIDALSNEMTTWARVLVDHHGWDVPNPPRRRPHNTAKPLVTKDTPRQDQLAKGDTGRGRGSVVIPVSSPSVDLACYAATWLAEHVGHLRMHPAALEAYRGLTDAIAAAELAMDRPEPQLFVGRCGQEICQQICQAPLYAPRDATGTRCERCGTYIADLDQRWDSALLKLRGYPATAAVIAGWVGDVSGVLVNRKLVNIWHHRGLIRVVDLDPKTGDPRFRIGAVLDRAAKSKPRKAG